MTSMISIVSEKQCQEGLFNITLNLLYKDSDTVLIDKDFSQKYSKGDAFSLVYREFLEKMKDEIQAYKLEQAILNSTGLAAIVTNLNAKVGV
jgi:hypothetical protein